MKVLVASLDKMFVSGAEAIAKPSPFDESVSHRNDTMI